MDALPRRSAATAPADPVPADLVPADPVPAAGLSAGAAPSERPFERRLVAAAPALRAWLRRVAGADAEDLAQEAIARALRYRGSFDGDRELGGWLARIGLRVYLDHRAAAARAPSLAEEPADVVAPTPTLPPRIELEEALARFAPVEREVLVRFHAGGERVADIAAAMDLPDGTVKSHLHRARQRLARSADAEDGR